MRFQVIRLSPLGVSQKPQGEFGKIRITPLLQEKISGTSKACSDAPAVGVVGGVTRACKSAKTTTENLPPQGPIVESSKAYWRQARCWAW